MLLPRVAKNVFILIASILFYSWGAPKFVFVILCSTIIDYYIVRTLHRSEVTLHRKLLLTSSLLINLGLLAYFKYANFFIENVNAIIVAGGHEPMSWVHVVLPIGISFYTFQTLTYSIDIYRKVHAPLEKLTDYLLYIMSFPQMIAGPIVRFTLIAEEIVSRRETIADRLNGFYRFSIGLGKKVLIANVMGEQADLIMNGDLASLNAGQAWLGILAYTFQIYFDFSGYSDMAIGLGRMIGFTFPENFNSPYTAKSITEFWRKWHMTLGDFMRNYLYIPLGGNRVSKGRMYFNLWLVFLLSGLWHGAAWNFILWGAFHGAFLILDRLVLNQVYNRIGTVLSTIITFFLVMFGWVIFRLETLSDIGVYFGRMFDFQTFTIPNAIPSFYFFLLLAVLFSWFVAFKKGARIASFFFERRDYSSVQHMGLAVLGIVLFFLSVSSINASGFNPFIYFRF